MKSLTRLVLLLFLGIDILFGSLATFALVKLLEPRHAEHAMALILALFAVKVAVWMLVGVSTLRPYEALVLEERPEQKQRLLADADAALQRFPMRFSTAFVGSWLLAIGSAYLVLRFGAREYFSLADGSGVAVVFILAAVIFGTLGLVFPVTLLVTAGPAGACSVLAREAGIELERRPIRLQNRVGLVAFCLGLGPLFWMAAIGYLTQLRVARRMMEAGGASLTSSDLSSGEFLINAGIFSLLVAFWSPFCAAALARAISVPIERLTSATREIVEEGNQTRIEVLPMASRDEIGVLAEGFNDLVDMMRELSHGADAISRGNLKVDIDRRGELPEAFGRMTHSLNEIVSRIRQTSVDLAATATEILATSQEHETAATSQSSAMIEISRTMDSLSESAAHVSESVAGVLSNAEQTLVTTDSMVERIESLSVHTGRMTELLNLIRDIADKSDLLALNGSLEASRAGESGQGFALVAAEMRRLAVRVTAAVEDVKKLVADVREASAATIMATEEGRRLARATTEAARQITLASQQQRTGTEQVSETFRGLTDVVTLAAAATSQTRTSAQGLKRQADELGELVRRFEVVEEAS